jgi:Pyruvate/2-oxoacid:ferredoxin oxidoreductase delta subunit
MPVSQQLESIVTFAISAFVITGVAVMMSRVLEEHHSISWEAKKPFIEKYGLWAVNRAEAFCPENDVACVEREAKRLMEVYKYRRGV